MALSAADQKIINEASEYNVGDVALNLKPGMRRTHKQRHSLRANVYPGELVNRAKKNGNFQFAWCPFKDTDFFYDLKEDGYKPVIEAEWVLGRETWEWFQPEKDRWRWSETKMLINRDEFLMFRDEDLYQQEMNNRLAINEDQRDARKDDAVEAASRIARNAGVEVEIEDANGRPNKAGVRRTTVS